MVLNTIHNLDCLDGFRQLPDNCIDVIVSDPPYGIDYQSQRKKDKSLWLPKIANDKKPYTDYIRPALHKLKPTGAMFVFTRWDVQQVFIDAITAAGGRVKSVLIWDKQVHGMGDLKASYGSRYESILFIPGRLFAFPGKRPQDILVSQKVPPSKLVHPNEKPVDLIAQLIEQTTSPGALVLDPFLGSGTTAVASIKTGRSFIGFELDPNYCKIAQCRIWDAVDAMLEEVMP